MNVKACQIQKDFVRKKRDTNIFTAVKPCDLELVPGTLTVITGRSGSGKSTLLNMLSGILRPTSGQVLYDEKDIYEMDDEALSAFRNENIGFIPQGKSAIASLSVMENILVPDILYGQRHEDRAMELMKRFGIEELKDVLPEELSGGELRRMAIARSLLKNPRVLFADEPTGDLDDENTRIVFQAIREVADSGVSVLVVTHETDVREYADVMLHMDAGEIQYA